ncbi:MAG: Rrf2 family transcriptional regulator [Actinomycetota bacterium]|nr:Rrf2 family transcriptional regulator [Actinomycetota bacterium]
MTLSKRGDYVVRSALALARAWPTGEPRKIREVVAEMGVPQTFASQILAELVRAGLASSKAGKDGGYRLSRAPEEIALVDVVEAGEGPLRAERCALGDGPCRWDEVCPLHETWRTATEALRQVLGATTLADLAQRDLDLEAGRASPVPDSHRHGPVSIAVDDWVHVEAGIAALGGCIAREQIVGRAVEGAYEEADALRAGLDPAGTPWSPLHALASCVPHPSADNDGVVRPTAKSASGATGADATDGGTADGAEPALHFSLSWEAASGDGVTSHADVELVATPVDPDRTQLKVHGRLRPPVASTPEPVDPEVVERLGQVVIRSLLRRIARATEEAAVSSHAPTKPRRSRSTARSGSANGTKNGTGARRGRATTEGTTAGAVRA